MAFSRQVRPPHYDASTCHNLLNLKLIITLYVYHLVITLSVVVVVHCLVILVFFRYKRIQRGFSMLIGSGFISA